MSIRVVAFDVHGTLAHFPPDRVRPIEVQRLLQRFGVQISYQAFEAARQATFFLDGPKRPIHGWVDFLTLLFARLEAKVSLDVVESVAAMYEARDGMVLFEDALPAIQAARDAGLKTCAFTTLPKFMVGKAMEDVGPLLDHYFDAAATGFAKGDPRYYAEIAGKLRVRPDEILALGDDRLCDCELPVESGWQAILLRRTGGGDGGSVAVGTKSYYIIDSLTEWPIVAAHEHCRRNRDELVQSETCGCFWCLTVMSTSEIENWIDDGETAQCPVCGIDSVIASAASYPLDEAFLKAMQKRWFGRERVVR